MTCQPPVFGFIVGLLLLLFLAPAAAAQDAYESGSVYEISYIRTEPGQFDAYMGDLASLWTRMMDRGIEEGILLSYTVLSSEPANRDDWDLMLLIEYPNFAALDDLDERRDAIIAEVLEGRDENAMTAERRKLREILGGKLARELVLKR